MKITADRPVCIGAGQCALVAEELFDQDDEGFVVLLEDEYAGARRAAALCPARAIVITESE